MRASAHVEVYIDTIYALTDVPRALDKIARARHIWGPCKMSSRAVHGGGLLIVALIDAARHPVVASLLEYFYGELVLFSTPLPDADREKARGLVAVIQEAFACKAEERSLYLLAVACDATSPQR